MCPDIPPESSDDMVKALEEDRKARKINTIPEVVRVIVSEYFNVKEAL